MKTKLKEIFQPTVTVAEIHEEFDTASEAFLQQIQEVLKNTSESEVDNANALKGLGFSQSGNVKKYQKLIESTNEAAEAKKYIDDYATRYSEKFITERMVGIICQKYGLVLGDTYSFIGEIPAKNAKEIIEFAQKFKAKDRRDNYYSQFMASRTITFAPSVSDGMIREYMPGYQPGMHSIEELRQRAEVLKERMWRREQEKKEEEERNVQPTFMVVGELSQFDMTGKKVDSKYRIVSDNPDPVILAQVKGGYLIVTKWGAEANIQELHNEKEN